MDKGQQFSEPVPEKLYHGTAADLGGRVLPASVHGGHSNWGDMGAGLGQPSREHAFATHDEGTAWEFADTASRQTGNRAYVATVEPEGPIRKGQFHSGLHEYVAPSFKVTGRLDTMPGRQGTFPQVDWNKYRAEGFKDANHPEFGESYGDRHPAVDVPGRVHRGQTDLFTGKTAAKSISADNDPDVARYHLRALTGYNDSSDFHRDRAQAMEHSLRTRGY